MFSRRATPTLNAHRALDRAGIVASSLCAIHCAVFALLPMVSVVATGFVVDPWVERLLVAVAVGLGLASLLSSFAFAHRDLRPLAVLAAGLAALAARALVGEHSRAEAVCSIFAACLLVSAHVLNLRLTSCCDRCVNCRR
jgi:hypothetical protein